MTDQTKEIGYANSIKDFLVYVDGLPTVRPNDIVVTEPNTRGWVSAVYAEQVEVLMIDEATVSPGQMFIKSGEKLTLTVGDFLLGRAINPLGIPIDGKNVLNKTKTSLQMDFEQPAKSLGKRRFITEQFVTGIGMIDTLIPLGRGQRELVMGDARSGKTGFIIDLIFNQRNTGTICIYASIGKPVTALRNLLDVMTVNKMLDYTVVIATSATDTPPLIFLTPHAALTVAEYFQAQGKDVLVILDDLGNHAKIYREISLQSSKTPGRESYPGDIFYQHSHLMERAGCFKDSAGGGSITLLPVIELNLNDFTTFIPTNVMSMTDGHLLFKASEYSQGIRPAIDVGLSVSRVGRQTQNRIQNALAYRIKQIMNVAQSLETVSRFSSELALDSQIILRQNEMIKEVLIQDSLTNISPEVQTIFLSLMLTNFFKAKTPEFLKKYKNQILQFLSHDSSLSALRANVFKLKDLDDFIHRLEPLGEKINAICK